MIGRHLFKSRTGASLILMLLSLTFADLRGGGPLWLRAPADPYRWGGNPPTARFHPDAGGLGPLTAEVAHQNFLAAAAAWEAIESSSIRVRDQGPINSIQGPEGAGDFALGNAFQFLGRFNDGISPIIFDNEDADGNGNGDIFDALGLGAGVLGISTPEFALDDGTILEGFMLLNGSGVDPEDVTGENFRGVMTHELGHFLNFAHSLVNGDAYFFRNEPSSSGSRHRQLPDGTPLDVDVDDLETMYPFGDPSVGGTGIAVATPNPDEVFIASTLYPDPARPLNSLGSLAGRLFLQDGVTPVTGGNMIVRDWSKDPVRDAISVISGDLGPLEEEFDGTYLINALTPGDRYSLEIRRSFVPFAGYTTPILNWFDPVIPGPDEYYSGPLEGASFPDQADAPPFLITMTAGGPNNPVRADLIFNSDFPPGNDDCGAAIELTDGDLPFEDLPKLSLATLEPGEPSGLCAVTEQEGSVWYRVTNTRQQPMPLHISTNVGDRDSYPLVQVYRGSCGNLSPIARACGNLDRPTIHSSFVEIEVMPSESVAIQVADSFVPNNLYTESGGPETYISIREAPPPPVNDVCSDAVAFDVDDLPLVVENDVEGAFTEPSEPPQACHGVFGGPPKPHHSTWYRLTNTTAQPFPLYAGHLVIQDAVPVVSQDELTLEVYSGDCQALMPRQCGWVRRGDLYAINDGLAIVPAFSSVLLRAATASDLLDFGGKLRLLIDSPAHPANDDCRQAEEIVLEDGLFTDTRDTRQAGSEPGEPVPSCRRSDIDDGEFGIGYRTPSNGVWYRFTNSGARTIELDLSTSGSDYDASLVVYKGNCDGGLAEQTCERSRLFGDFIPENIEPLDEDFFALAQFGGLRSDSRLLAGPGESYLIKVEDLRLPMQTITTSGNHHFEEFQTRGGNLVFSVQGTLAAIVAIDLDDGDAHPTAGGHLAYALKARNLTTFPVDGFQTSLSLPPEVIFLGADTPQGDCALEASKVVCALGTLQPGQEIAVSVDVSPLFSGTISGTLDASWSEMGVDEVEPTTRVTQVAAAVPLPLDFAAPNATRLANRGSQLFGDSFVGLAFANVSDESAQDVGITLLNASGTAVQAAISPLTLPPQGQLARLSTEIDPGGTASTLLGSSGTAPVRSFFLAGTFDESKLDGLGRQLEPSEEWYALHGRLPAQGVRDLFVFNPHPGQEANVAITLMAYSGTTLAQQVVQVPPQGTFRGQLGNLFDSPSASQSGYLRVESDLPVQGFELAADAKNFSTSPGQTVTRTDHLVVPQVFVDGQGGDTELLLLNLEDLPVEVRALLRDNDGMTISEVFFEVAPRQLLRRLASEMFDIRADPGESLSGSVIFYLEAKGFLFVNLGPPRFAFLGQARFFAEGGDFDASLPMVAPSDLVGIPITSEFFTRTVFLQVAQSPSQGIFTGLSIFNAFNFASFITVRAYDEEGEFTAEKRFLVTPGQRRIDLLDGQSLFGEDFQQIGGHLVVETRVGPALVYALYGSYDLRYMAAVEGQRIPPPKEFEPFDARPYLPGTASAQIPIVPGTLLIRKPDDR